MNAQLDAELSPWLFGVLHGKPTRSGDFLRLLVKAAFHADPQNYVTLRPALLAMKEKYPDYHCEYCEVEDDG